LDVVSYACAEANVRSPQFIQKDADHTTRFKQCLSNRLWISDLRPNRNYVEREFFYIVVQFSPGKSLEQYEAIISRVPFERQILDAGCAQESPVCHGLYSENLVALAAGDSLDDADWTYAPTWLTIKRADKDVNRLGGLFHFSRRRDSSNVWGCHGPRSPSVMFSSLVMSL
jgi:hypothetical protein